MARRTIIGVDFSGARRENKTWITEGNLRGDRNQVFQITRCERVSRADLTKRLKKRNYSVAAIDFPFSVPIAFANFWQPNIHRMQDLWRAAYDERDVDSFRAIVSRFAPAVADEVLRIGDMHVPGSTSCLHRAPDMVAMTFEGMKMLYTLTKTASFHIPPLPRPKKSSPVLLETMPGAALTTFGLPDTYYKSGATANRLRTEILDNLAGASEIEMPNLNDYRDRCLRYDDALDSLVAAVVAALWHKKEKFHKPSNRIVSTICRPTSIHWASIDALAMQEREVARREGWIYIPDKC